MNFPKEMEEAARIDGSGFFGTFFKIVLPNARPAIGGHWQSILFGCLE